MAGSAGEADEGAVQPARRRQSSFKYVWECKPFSKAGYNQEDLFIRIFLDLRSQCSVKKNIKCVCVYVLVTKSLPLWPLAEPKIKEN